MLVGFELNGHHLRHPNALCTQGVHLVGVVRHEPHFGPTQVFQELRRDVKLPRIRCGPIARWPLGVKPLILKVVGFELLHQSNSPSLLSEVQHGTTLLRHTPE